MAIKVAKAESGLRCNALNKNTNKTTDHSIFQINSIHSWRGNIKDCTQNILIAKEIFDEQGWCPWVAAKKLKICK